jgi:hypothetical protein
MLAGLLIFLLIVIALLAIPVALEFSVEWPDGAQNEIVLVWALGLVRARIPTSSSEKASTADGVPPEPKKGGRGKSARMLAAVRQRPFRQRVYRFVGDLWRAVIKENVQVRARVGLGDPADTGQLWAVVGPVSGMLSGVKGVSVAIEPDFVNATFDVDGSGRLQVVPLQVIAISMGLLGSPAIWQGLRAVRAS